MENLQVIAIIVSLIALVLAMTRRPNPPSPVIYVLNDVPPPNQGSFSAIIGIITLCLLVIAGFALF